MKILVVSNLYPPFVIGGYEINCANVVGQLLVRGHDVMVVTGPNHIPGPPDPPHVQRCLNLPIFAPNYAISSDVTWWNHCRDTSNYDNVAALYRMLRAFRPDVVFLWNLHGLGGLHLIDFLNVTELPWAIYLGDRVYEQLIMAAPAYINSIFRGTDPGYFARGGIMAVSEHLVEEICRMAQFEFIVPPTIVHGYAVTVGNFVPHAYRQNGRTRFLTAGRVSEDKGIKIICDAVAKLVNDGVIDFEVNVFGEGDLSFYVNYSITIGAGHQIKFHGAVPQRVLHSHYQTHDVFLFPTWSREPFAFAPFEAAAYGCVPILTADCGCSERIVNNVHGIKIERTSEGLAFAMRAVMEGSVNLERMGRAAGRLVRQDLTLDGHIDKIMLVLQNQLSNRQSAKLDDPRSQLLAYVKHHLSVAFRYGVTG